MRRSSRCRCLGLGFLWILRDPERQAWHDRIAGTYVVKVPRNWPIWLPEDPANIPVMSWLDWRRGAPSLDAAQGGDTDTVRRIVSELDKLEPDRARYLAAFAYVLSRVAGADLHIDEAETGEMVELVGRVGRLPEAQAILVVEIAKSQNRLFGGTENFLVTREFRAVASDAERRDLLHCLFAVAAADSAISAEEEAQIWQIAGEVGFSREEFVAVRFAYADKRTVLRREP